jgi:hypothetical protein
MNRPERPFTHDTTTTETGMTSNTRYLAALHLGAVALLLLSTVFPRARDEHRADDQAQAVRELIDGNGRYVAGVTQPSAAGLSGVERPPAGRIVVVSVAPPHGAPEPAVLFDLPSGRVCPIVADDDPACLPHAVAQVERALEEDDPLLIVVLQYRDRASADTGDGLERAIKGSPAVSVAVHRSAVRLAIAVVETETWRTSVR